MCCCGQSERPPRAARHKLQLALRDARQGSSRLLAAACSEQLAQEARRHRRERVDGQNRVGDRTRDAEIHREQSLVLPAAEERAEEWNLREGVVQSVGGNEGAGNIDPVPGLVDVAAEGETRPGSRKPPHP